MGSTHPERTFRPILYDALASEAMGALTAGVFLTGFLVELGASNLAIGLLAAVPFTVQFLQLPAVVLVGAPALQAYNRHLGRGYWPRVPDRRRRHSTAQQPASSRWSCSWHCIRQWPLSLAPPGIPGCPISSRRMILAASSAAAPWQRPQSPSRLLCSGVS